MLFNKKKEHPRTPKSSCNKVIITGPGRSGTTLLVMLLTELGFDTGFHPETAKISKISGSGLEKGLYVAAHQDAPLTPNYIIKSPYICNTLGQACERGDLLVDHVYIPIRELEFVLKSRARVSSVERGHPGGIVGESDQDQRIWTMESLYNLMFAIGKYELPHTILNFPRLANDPLYLYQKLEYLMKDISYLYFENAFKKVVNQDYIHDFQGRI